MLHRNNKGHTLLHTIMSENCIDVRYIVMFAFWIDDGSFDCLGLKNHITYQSYIFCNNCPDL